MTIHTAKAKKVRFRTPTRADLEAMEAVQAARGSYAPDEAIRQSVEITSQITRMLRGKLVATPVNLYEVLRVLVGKKVPFVLTGAYAIGTYTGRPRATKDVDILTKSGRNHLRAVKALKQAFPELEARPFRILTAFFRPGETESVIDVSFPYRKDNAEALVDTQWVDDKENGVRYRIPSLECCLANKYGAMIVVTRDSDKRHQDVADFTLMVKHSMDQGQQPIDLDRLRELGELVWAEGGRDETVRLVEMVKAKRTIELSALGAP